VTRLPHVNRGLPPINSDGDIAQLAEQLLLAREQAEALHDAYLKLRGR
jgi:hypothetical protein